MVSSAAVEALLELLPVAEAAVRRVSSLLWEVLCSVVTLAPIFLRTSAESGGFLDGPQAITGTRLKPGWLVWQLSVLISCSRLSARFALLSVLNESRHGTGQN